MEWQWPLVLLCIGSAAWYVARAAARTWRGGCTGCGCKAADATKPGRIPLPTTPAS